MPAQQGRFTIHTTTGQDVEVWQAGDEHGHWLCDAQGNAYILTSVGAEKLSADGLLSLQARRLSLCEANSLRRQQRSIDMADSRRLGRADAAATRRGLVILVDFDDYHFRYDAGTFNRQFNETGFNLEGHIGSVRDYFREQSYGAFDMQFDIVGPYTLSHSRSYYGENFTSGSYLGEDMHLGELVIEACQAADTDIDYTLYDDDGDKSVDQVLILYAGGGEHQLGAPSDLLYPKEWTLSNHQTYLGDGTGAITLDGVTIDSYAAVCELNAARDESAAGLNGIGTPCHEFSHCLGLPDFYDVNGNGAGMAYWDLLDYGSYNGPKMCGEVPAPFTAYERSFCGWLTPIDLTSGTGATTITGMPCLQDEGVAYRISHPTDANRYYLLEHRQPRGWDLYTGGADAHGMLIMYVDYDATAWEKNLVNSVAGRQRMTYLPADGSYDATGTMRDESDIAADLYPGPSACTAVALFDQQLTDIAEMMTDDGETMLSFVYQPVAAAGDNPNDGLDPSDKHMAEVAGSYIERSDNLMGYYACQDSVTISFSDNGDSIYIYNLQGYHTTLRGFVNWRTGQLSFAHQTFLPGIVMDNYDDDGNWLSADTVSLMFSADSIPTPVTGRILSDYSVQLDGWLCESYFEGEGWDWTYELYMSGTTFVRPNAVMETRDVWGNTHNYRVNISYADDLQTALVTGWGGKAGITVQVRSNGSLALEPLQYFYFYNFYYGYASLYQPNYNGTQIESINSIRYIHGTGDDSTWTFEPWAACFDMGTNYPRAEWLTTSTTLRYTDGSTFCYPTAGEYGWQGSGSESDPYLLCNAADFSLLASHVAAGRYFDGLYFRVADDIDFTGSNFSGVANNQSTTYSTNLRFEGHLDGDGHTLSHLSLGSPEMSHVGLFGELRGDVSNLTIDGTCSFVGYDYVGAFAGDMKTTTDARLTNCRNYASVTGYDAYIGGLAGSLAKDHVASGCYNAGTVTSYNCKAGGITGYAFRATMNNCQNDGNVVIAAKADNNPLLAQAGGLAGYACGTTFSHCLNTGTIEANAKAGGLCGEIYNSIYPSHLTDCVNVGAVLCEESGQTGAIVGYCTSTTTTAQNVCYDAQRQFCGAWQGAAHEGVNALTTTDITSGQTELDDDYWTQLCGLYPALRSFVGQGTDWRHCLIRFADDETAGDVRTTATLAAGVTGSLRDSTIFRLNGNILSLIDDRQPSATDLLTLRYGSYTTSVPLRHLDASSLSGTGTREDPFLIRTTSDWLIFADEANVRGCTFANQYISVRADLDFTDVSCRIPYQNGFQSFEGHLIGNGHVFSHLHADLGSFSTASSVGQGLLLASCAKDGSIQELRLEDCSIRGYEKVGLLVGILRGILMDCETDSLCSVIAENRYAGGLCGTIENEGFIYNCENRASVWSEQFVGGIAGYGSSTAAQIVYTDNYGHVYNFDIAAGRPGVAHVAGLCPRFDGRVTYCDNYGLIESYNGYAAGLVCKAYNGATFEGCTNHGEVIDHDTNLVTGYAAGIVCESSGPIVSCGNEGRIFSALNYVGGIVSSMSDGWLTDCWNTGDVQAGNVYAGGIASEVSADDLVLLRCWNMGNVVAGYISRPATESNKAGGIIGTTIEYSPILSQCWNGGEIRCDKVPGDDGSEDYDADWDFTDAGGLVGSGAPVIRECFNAGRVIARKQAGGLVGRMTGGSILCCYNVGAVCNDTLPQYASHLIGHAFTDGQVSYSFFCSDADNYRYALDDNYPSLTRAAFVADDGDILALGDAFDYSDALHYPMLKAFCAGSETEPDERSIAAHNAATQAFASPDEAITPIHNDEGTTSTTCYNLFGQHVAPRTSGFVIANKRVKMQ